MASKSDTVRHQFTKRLVKILLRQGWYISVHNGRFGVCSRCQDYTAICEALFSNDKEVIRIFSTLNSREPAAGWVELSYTSHFRDLFVDYSVGVMADMVEDLERELATVTVPDGRKKLGQV